MSDRTHTTVVLNDSIQKIKDELAPVYGLKRILSAGLWLFSRLSADEQKAVITELNRLGPAQVDAKKIVDVAATHSAMQKQKKGRHVTGAA
jgi:hypothetical protein